ncbi:hypothetical protein BBR47_59430 [Brevibacillus brevis NBRC 100599]|uniref:Uncharacterized protein n=1 Tax=Brevibacillus brevis (strain 47 / JCM 6285 / NBRC 100599) TaxID=358681 RepID=C0ZA66_BREBN|nr:hypothetical protein BBR47_59430 [Brevibacillus brevis NBRC 100599]
MLSILVIHSIIIFANPQPFGQLSTVDNFLTRLFKMSSLAHLN